MEHTADARTERVAELRAEADRSIAAGAAPAAALDAGFHQALIVAAIFLLAAALIALRTTGARGEPQTAELTAVRQAAAGDATVRLTER